MIIVFLDRFHPAAALLRRTSDRCLVMPCERIGVWAVSVPPVGQRRLRRSPPALRPRIRWRREWVDNYQLSPSV
eukprot:scaffold9139_cov109-Isochrysis_galbana.AAC.2